MPLTVCCLMAATKGLYAHGFLRRLHERGHRVLVVTRAAALELPWPREWIDGLYGVEDFADPTRLRDAVAYLARGTRLDRIVGPGEFDIELAAGLREHFRLPGLSLSGAALYRDKLAMRGRAAAAGLPVPAFTGLFHHAEIGAWLDAHPGPWLLKPRTEASATGIQRFTAPGPLWERLHALGDRASHHLLEVFEPGDVYHVDSLVQAHEIRFAQAHRYGTPILQLHREGGVYTTVTLPREASLTRALLDLDRKVLLALGLEQGVTHVEYIRRATDGQLLFLEASARVGAGMIEELVEATSGLDLWGEWADLEVASPARPYELPEPRPGYGGLAIVMTGAARPDLGPLAGLGVRASVPKPYHAAALVLGEDPRAVEERVQAVARHMQTHYLAPLTGA